MVVRAGALGDVVLTIPAIRALRLRYPAARIDVVGYPDRWELAGSLVDARASIERPRFAGLLTADLSPKLLAWLRGEPHMAGDAALPVDLAIAWTVRDPHPVFEAAGIDHIVHASPFPPPGVHAAVWYLQTFGLLFPPGDEPLLSFSEEEHQAAQQALRDQRLNHPIILHPGAGAPWKRWPAQRFGILARTLRKRGDQVVLLEGPADGAAVDETLQHSGPLPVLRSTSIRQLAGILSEAQLFVGNDSGVTHLAAAAGTPTIALFGPTDPASWAPLGNVRILRACAARAERQEQIVVCADPACMSGIEVEEVLAEARAMSFEV